LTFAYGALLQACRGTDLDSGSLGENSVSFRPLNVPFYVNGSVLLAGAPTPAKTILGLPPSKGWIAQGGER